LGGKVGEVIDRGKWGRGKGKKGREETRREEKRREEEEMGIVERRWGREV
jgi:hypothetical protein